MRTKNILRSIALITAMIFSCTTVCWSAPSMPFGKEKNISSPQVFSLDVPNEYGTVKSRFKGASEYCIVYIQDAHASSEAQKNISQIISSLSEQGVEIVGVEGATGAIDVSEYRKFPNKAANRRACDQLLKEGFFQAAEHAQVTSAKQIELWGIEDSDLYVSNYKAFLKVAEYQDSALDGIGMIKAILSDLKSEIYSDALFEFDSLLPQSATQPESFFSYYLLLCEWSQKLNVDLLKYINFAHFKEFVDASSADFISMKSFPDFEKVLQDANKLEYEIKKELAASESEEILIKLNRHADLLFELFSLTAQNETVEYFNSNKQDLVISSFVYYIKEHASSRLGELTQEHVVSIQNILPQVESFYAFAGKRDGSFIDNILERLKKKHARVGVVIAGGHHSCALTARLRAQNISYIEITPHLSDLVQDIPYFEIMTGFGQRNLFSSFKYLAPVHIFNKLAQILEDEVGSNVGAVHDFSQSIGFVRQSLYQLLAEEGILSLAEVDGARENDSAGYAKIQAELREYYRLIKSLVKSNSPAMRILSQLQEDESFWDALCEQIRVNGVTDINEALKNALASLNAGLSVQDLSDVEHVLAQYFSILSNHLSEAKEEAKQSSANENRTRNNYKIIQLSLLGELICQALFMVYPVLILKHAFGAGVQLSFFLSDFVHFHVAAIFVFAGCILTVLRNGMIRFSKNREKYETERILSALLLFEILLYITASGLFLSIDFVMIASLIKKGVIPVKALVFISLEFLQYYVIKVTTGSGLINQLHDFLTGESKKIKWSQMLGGSLGSSIFWTYKELQQVKAKQNTRRNRSGLASLTYRDDSLQNEVIDEREDDAFNQNQVFYVPPITVYVNQDVLIKGGGIEELDDIFDKLSPKQKVPFLEKHIAQLKKTGQDRFSLHNRNVSFEIVTYADDVPDIEVGCDNSRVWIVEGVKDSSQAQARFEELKQSGFNEHFIQLIDLNAEQDMFTPDDIDKIDQGVKVVKRVRAGAVDMVLKLTDRYLDYFDVNGELQKVFQERQFTDIFTSTIPIAATKDLIRAALKAQSTMQQILQAA